MNKLGSQYAGGLLVAKDGELTVRPSALLTQLNDKQVDTIHQLATYNTSQHNWLTSHDSKIGNHAGQLAKLTSRVNALDDAQYKGACVLNESARLAWWTAPSLAIAGVNICQKVQKRDDCVGTCVWIPRP